MKKFGFVLAIVSIIVLVSVIETLGSFGVLTIQGSSGILIFALLAIGFAMITDIGVSRSTKIIRIIFIFVYSVAIILGLISMFLIDDFCCERIIKRLLVVLLVAYSIIFLVQDPRAKGKRKRNEHDGGKE